MATMRRPPEFRQTPRQTKQGAWFASLAGQEVLRSEDDAVQAALDERPGQPWLWLAPMPVDRQPAGHGLQLWPSADGWSGQVRCGGPLPLANESVATVMFQHIDGGAGAALLDECARVLVPGGRLWLFALNPLAPYRWRWQGSGLGAHEPVFWRRRLRKVGLLPEPVSQGLGPRWQLLASPQLQHGAGLRAAYLLRAEKRRMPLTPLRQRAPMRIGGGVPAA